MKYIFWSFILWGGAIMPLLAEVVLQADFADGNWQRNGNWQLSAAGAVGKQQPNTYPALGRRLALAAGTYYKISFRAQAADGTAADNRIVLFAGDSETAAWPCPVGESVLTAYLRTEAAVESFKLQLQGASACTVTIKDLTVTKLTDADLQKITVDFNDDGGPVPSFFRKQNWPGPGELTVVSAEEHIEGGRAMRIAPAADKGNFAVYSNLLPLLPGKKYKLSFWGRAMQPCSIRLGLDGYLAGQAKHWHKLGAFQLTPEWRLYSSDFDSPNLNDFPYMAKGTAYFNLGVTGGPAVELKMLTLEVLP